MVMGWQTKANFTVEDERRSRRRRRSSSTPRRRRRRIASDGHGHEAQRLSAGPAGFASPGDGHPGCGEVAQPCGSKARITDLAGALDQATGGALRHGSKPSSARRGRRSPSCCCRRRQPEPSSSSAFVSPVLEDRAKGRDDGLIVIVAKDDRKVRVEVGYGLEGRYPMPWRDG